MIPDNVLIELIREVSRNTRRIDDLPRPEVGSGGSGPADAEYLVNAASADLTNEIVVAAASGYIIRGHDPGAGVTWEAYDASTDGQILIGDGTDINSVAITGDINITNAGVTELRLYDTGADHYLTLTYNEDATANRNLNLDLNDGDRNLTLEGDLTVESASLINQDLTTDASPTFAGLTLNGNESITSGNEQRFYDADDSNYVGFEAPALTANQIWKLPTADGLANQALVTDAAGNLSWATVSNLTGLGTDNRITRWDGTDTLQDSLVQIDDSGNIEFVNGGLYIGRNGDVRIKFDSANGYIDTILSDDGGSDRFRIVDSATAEKAYIDSNGNGQFDGDVTAANFYGADGTEFGISGNELLTVNAAGTFAFSGISGVAVEDGDWIGNGAAAGRITFNTTSDTIVVNDASVRIDTASGSNPLWISRLGSDDQGLKIYADDRTLYLDYIEDAGEVTPGSWRFYNSLDGGASLEWLRVTNINKATINPNGDDLDFYVEASGVADALFVRGSDGQITLGALGAGFVRSTAGGILSSAAIVVGDLPAHASTHESGGGDEVDHDALLNFVADEHIDHTSVTLTAGDGLTGGGDISANRTFDLNTPGTLTAATGNSAAGNHTHAITTTSDGTADVNTILQTNASGQITLEDLFVPDDGVVGVSGGSYIIFDSSEDKLELYTNNVLRAVFGPNISFDTQLQMDGNSIVFDADDDTGFIANSDDDLDVVIAGVVDFDFQANEFNVLSGSHITMADDTWIGLGAAAGRFIFDSTPTPDEIRLADGNFDLNGNDLIIDSDGDSYIHASADDTIQYVISGAADFSMTANTLNILSGSDIDMADGTSITGGAGEPTITFDSTNDYLEISNADVGIGTTPGTTLHLYGSDATNVGIGMRIGNTSNTLAQWTIASRDDLATDALVIRENNPNTADRIFLLAGGNLGINVSDPAAPVEIMGASTTASGGTVRVSNSTDAMELRLGTNATNDYGFIDILENGVSNNRDLLLQSAGGNTGIGVTATSGKLHVDQSSSTGAQPVIFADQGDTSEQIIIASSDSTDRDITFVEFDVTGNPSWGWDESETAFTQNANLILSHNDAEIQFTGTSGPQGLSFVNGECVLYYRTDPNQLIVEDAAGTDLFSVDVDNEHVYVNSLLFINETANSDMTIGFTINQEGNDDQAFALKDSTDVAHGITDLTETDTYGSFEKAVASGGMEINGISGNSVAEGVTILAVSQSESTADDSGADGAIKLTGAKKSGTDVAGLSNNANIVAITNDNTTTHIFKGNGDIRIAGSVTENDWDDYDDLALLHGLRAEMTPSLREKFGQWISYARPILEKTKVVSYEDNGRFMMSQKGLHMLVIDTVRVLFERFIQAEKKSKEEFAQLERRILQLEGGVS